MPSWGAHTLGVSSPIHQDSEDRSTGSGQLGKATASPPLVWGSVCPAPVWSKLHGCGQLGMAAGTGRDRDTAPRKKWETKYGPGQPQADAWGRDQSSVKEKHSRGRESPAPHCKEGRSPPGSVGHPRPSLAGLGAPGLAGSPKGAVSLTPCTALTRSLTRGRDLRPGLMSGMLLMQRRNLTAAPLPQGRPSQATGKKTENTSHVRGSWGAGHGRRSPVGRSRSKAGSCGGVPWEEPHQIAN